MNKQSDNIPQQESSGVVVRETLKEIADKANVDIRLRNKKLIGMFKEQLRRCIQEELLNSAKNGNYSLEFLYLSLCKKINIYPELEKYNSYKVIVRIISDVSQSVASDNGISFECRDNFLFVFKWE